MSTWGLIFRTAPRSKNMKTQSNRTVSLDKHVYIKQMIFPRLQKLELWFFTEKINSTTLTTAGISGVDLNTLNLDPKHEIFSNWDPYQSPHTVNGILRYKLR